MSVVHADRRAMREAVLGAKRTGETIQFDGCHIVQLPRYNALIAAAELPR
jgi:hypothetical protein